MPIKTGVILLLFILTACHSDEQSTLPIRFHGLNIKTISNENPFQLTRIQYSSGKSGFLLTGDLIVDNETESFSILMNKDMRREEFKVLVNNPPKCCLDLEELVITHTKGICEITWRSSSDKRFLYLKNGVSELR